MKEPTIEQTNVLNEERNLIVSASAGSGKTTTMIQKVIKILEKDEKSDIRNILMLTFSRAAAAEMREKLIKSIYESGNKRLEKQLDLIQFADIETIDSFCYKLVKKYFNFAGIDPTVEMGDASEIELLLSETYDRLREEKIKNHDKDFISLERDFKTSRNDSLLKDIVIDIYNYSKRMPESFGFLDKCINPPIDLITNTYLKLSKLRILGIKEYLEKAINKLNECVLYDKDGLLSDYYSVYSDSLSFINSMYCANNIVDFFANSKNLPIVETIRANKNKKELLNEYDGAFIYEHASEVKDRINNIKNSFLEDENKYNYFISRKAVDKTRNNLISLVLELEGKFKERKQKKNLISFDDSIILTLKILSDDVIRDEVINIYKYIFIDEYQDTNYLQEQLLDNIVSQDGRNTLFAVGDIKQAIYHFRGAEPSIFLNREYKYASNKESGKKLTMATNFRSNEGILDFTNKVCSKIMIEDTCEFNYDKDAELRKPNNVNIDSIGDAVEIYTCRKTKDNGDTNLNLLPVYSVENDVGDMVNDIQARFVADKIIELIDTAQINNHSIRYKDIAILLRKGSLFEKITDALKEKEIPFYSVKDQKNKSQEREILVDCIRLALNADQDIPLYNVLSSSISGITRKEFMSLVREIKVEGEKNPTVISLWESINRTLEDKNTRNKISEFIKFINQLKDFSAYMTVSDIMTYILESGYDAFLMQKGEDKIAEINNFIQFVSTLSVNNDVADFINYYDNVYEGNRVSSAQDAVAIMTMHASKGLEFPIVFLPYQEEKSSRGGFGKSSVTLDKDLGCGYGVKNDEGDDFKFVSSFESEVISRVKKAEERKEALRLMYVAFTRAQNKLILTAMVGDNFGLDSAYDDNISSIDVVKFGLGKDWDLYAKDIPEEADFYSNTHKDLVIREPVKAKEFDFGVLNKRKYRFENEIKTPVKVSVSNILREENNYGATPFEADINEKALLGTAIHSVMQNISYDLKDIDEVRGAIKELVEKGFLQIDEAAAIDPQIILKALQSHIITMARDNVAKREQPFILFDYYKDVKQDSQSNEKVMIQGVIDLLIISGDKCTVVDFKTGDKDVNPKYMDQFKKKTRDKYKKQLDIYAKAVEKILGYKVEQKIIYCMYTGTEIEV